jgi:hypothetical protein
MTTTPMALESDPVAWRDSVLDLIDAKCRRGERFTSDDLHEVGEPPKDCMWGAVIRTAVGRRMIQRVSYRTTGRRQGRGNAVGYWEPDPATYRPAVA